MPSSNVFIIPQVINYVCKVKPASILEFGVGFGKFGYLLREYLEVCYFNFSPANWRIKIDGIEISDKYVSDFSLLKQIYNKIFVGDMVDYLYKIDEYDCVIAIDVIEHLPKQEASVALKEISKAKVGIVSIPLGQGWLKANRLWVDINEHERHLSSWEDSEIDKFNPVFKYYVCDKLGNIGIYIFDKEGLRL